MSFEYDAKALAQHLGNASPAGAGWRACCPAHDDKKPSLAIYDRPSGKPFVKCMAGCDFKAIQAELVRLGLWPEQGSRKPTSQAKHTIKRALPLSPVPPDAGEPDYAALVGWTPTKLHRYLDADRRLLHLIARIDRANGSKDIRPIVCVRETNGATAWKAMAPAEPRPLYGLDLLAERPNAAVLVVEGEKAADAARERLQDYVVVCWSGGAKAVDKADWSPLRGRDVVLWPDNDDAGKKAMQDVAAALRRQR